MKTLYFDCGMGAAGDMLSAALLELFDDKQAVLDELNALGIPGVEFKAEVSTKCGINGTHLSVTVNGEEEESVDVHDHEHHDHDGQPRLAAKRNAAAGAKASRTAHAAHAPAVLDRRAFLKILPAHEKTSLKHQTHSEL